MSEMSEKLSRLKGSAIDVDLGISNSGTEDIYVSILKTFFKYIDSNIKELEKLFRDGNYTDYTIKAHAVKSSARSIGANDLGENARKLEYAGKNGDLEYIVQNHTAFIEEYKSYKELLEPVFITNNEESIEKTTADASILKEVFGLILEAARQMECSRIEEILGEMEAYRIPEGEMELWDKLKEATDQFDYESIVKLLEDQE